jgi:hypothetical protein
MFSTWQKEKATTALIDEAQALADKLAAAKPHIRDSHAAAAQFWAAVRLSEGVRLEDLQRWKPADIKRFVTATQTRIAELRKTRDYDSSDGLAIWLHTARAVTEPRISPAARDIWRQLAKAGPNAASMASEMLDEAGLPAASAPIVPKGFASAD